MARRAEIQGRSRPPIPAVLDLLVDALQRIGGSEVLADCGRKGVLWQQSGLRRRGVALVW